MTTDTDLSTADAVLVWAGDVGDTRRSTCKHLFDYDGTVAKDRNTATYLTECVRLRKALEKWEDRLARANTDDRPTLMQIMLGLLRGDMLEAE